MSKESGAEMSLEQKNNTEGKHPKTVILDVSTEDQGTEQAAEHTTAVEDSQTECEANDEVIQSSSSDARFLRRVSSLTDLHKYQEQRKPSVKLCKSEGNITSTEFVILFDAPQALETTVKDHTGQQLHFCDNKDEIQSTIEETVAMMQTDPEVTEAENITAVETVGNLQTQNEVSNEVLRSLSSDARSLRRVSSLTDLHKYQEQRKPSVKLCKSEGNITSTEFVILFDVPQVQETTVKDQTGHQLHSCHNEDEIQSPDLMDESSEPSMDQTELELKEENKDTQIRKEEQFQNRQILRLMSNEQRRRSFSDSSSLRSPGILPAERPRKTKSYTTLPHIDTRPVLLDDRPASFVHRTSCFRLMPHLSQGSILDPNFPTVSVLSISSQFEDYPLNVACEVSSDSEDSENDLDANKENVLHSWRKPSCRPRSYSVPVQTGAEPRSRTWSLPNMDEKHLRFNATMHKVKTSPSRLQFPEQALEKLKEESSGRQSSDSVRPRSSSVMSLVENSDGESVDQPSSPQESTGSEEVMGRWINRQRRPSITQQPSFSLVKEVNEANDEEDESDLQKTPSAVSLVNQVTEQVLSSHEVNVSSESEDDQSSTVEAAVKRWKKKESGRRVTLASISPLTDSPKYASEIEQQAFRKIKKWKDSFALKLDNVLGKRFEEMAAKREEELARAKKPKVLNVPMNLSDEEMGRLRSKLVLELKRKSSGSDHHLFSDYPPSPSSLPIPRVKFPRRAYDQNPENLKAQMMKELSRRVSCTPGEEGDGCHKPSSLVPDLSRTSLQGNRQSIVFIPRGLGNRTLDADSIRDLLSWHEAERKRLKAELEGLPQAESDEKQVLIDRDDANKVLHSMMKIMEEIFTGTMKRFMGTGEQDSKVDSTEKTTHTTRSRDTTETKQTKESEMTRDKTEGYDPQVEAVQPEKDLKFKTDVTNLSESASTTTLSSESTAELLSSESSLTGISFSSSNEAFSICHELDRATSTNTALKDNSSLEFLLPSTREESGTCGVPHVKGSESAKRPSQGLYSEAKAEVSDRSDLVRIESIELLLEDSNENLNNDVLVASVKAPTKQFAISSKASEEITTCCSSDTEKPREHIVDFETLLNKNENMIRQLQQALQQKTQSEDVLKQRSESLKIELNSAKNNTDYWFNQCVKKREKIEHLLNSARDMNKSNFELRQAINSKSLIIKEKDKEIQNLKEGKTKTEILLQEMKQQLSKANKETERLKMLVRKYEEEKLRSARILQVKPPSKVSTLRNQSSESQKYKGDDTGIIHTTHKETKINISSGRNGKVLESELKQSEVSSLRADAKPLSKDHAEEMSTVSDNDVKRKEIFGAIMSDESSSSPGSPLTTRFPMSKDPEKTKKAITEWLSEVIRQARTKFSMEPKLVSYNKGAGEDGKHAATEKESVRYSLREVVSSFKEKISKDVPRLPKQQKKNLFYSTVPKTNKEDRQRTPISSEDAANGFNAEWNQGERENDERSFVLLLADLGDKSRIKMSADVSTDVSDSMEPFSDVILPESIEASLADSIDSVEPFGDVFIPWQECEDAKTNQTPGAVTPSPKQLPFRKLQIGESLLAKDAKSIAPEEKKSEEQTAVEELVFRNLQDGSVKKVYQERKVKQDTEENTAHEGKTSVFKKGLDRKIKTSINNRQMFSIENGAPKQHKLTNVVHSINNSVQGSSSSRARAIFDSLDEVEFGTGTHKVIPFSNEFSTKGDIEHFIADFESKTESPIELKSKQPSSAGKVLQFKLNDPKFVSSSASNNSGFIDSITVEIKLNKEQLIKELANSEPRQCRQDNTTFKFAKVIPVAKDENHDPDKLTQLILQRVNQQENERTVPFDRNRANHRTGKERNSYGAEFIKHREIATQRWISDLMKSIGSAEKKTELTENGRSKVSDKDRERVESQNGEFDSLAPECSLLLHGRPTKTLPLTNKHSVSKQKTWKSPQMNFRQFVENNHSSYDSLQTTKSLPYGPKEQQRKAEREARIALWKEKNECLNGAFKDRNLQDVGKFTEKSKLAKTKTGASQLANQTKEKGLHYLLDMCRSARHVLKEQAEQKNITSGKHASSSN